MPLISICIPAYKRIEYLHRLLQSIFIQTFKDFEVIVTDDSPGNEVKMLCDEYRDKLPIRYHKNAIPLGTPENWNEAIRRAKGKWIKLMHDDDWFASAESLRRFVDLAELNPSASFIFCGSAIYKNGKMISAFRTSRFAKKLLDQDPANLFYRNFIGPPSVTLCRNDTEIWYDKRMKWLVDIDYYIRYLRKHGNYSSSPELLINVGFNDEQVTNQVIYDRNIVLTETFLLLSKNEYNIFLRIWNFDAAWRLMRNYSIRTAEELHSVINQEPGSNYPVPEVFYFILKKQKNFSSKTLKTGWVSKLLMTLAYCSYRLWGIRR